MSQKRSRVLKIASLPFRPTLLPREPRQKRFQDGNDIVQVMHTFGCLLFFSLLTEGRDIISSRKDFPGVVKIITELTFGA